MIDVLAEKLPDISRVVHYEDMVVDPAAALRTAAACVVVPCTIARCRPPAATAGALCTTGVSAPTACRVVDLIDLDRR